MKKTAHCLCNKVKFEFQEVSDQVGACHCDICRKWTGGPLLAVDCGTEIKVEGEQYLSQYASSEWAERAFCSLCGTHLYYKLLQTGQHIVPAGLLDDERSLHFDHQIFIEKKPTYYSFSNDTKNITGEELFAQFAAGENS